MPTSTSLVNALLMAKSSSIQSNRLPIHATGSPAAIRALYAHGVDINAVDADMNTPLHCIPVVRVPTTTLPLISTLLLLGGDVEARNQRGDTPAFNAVMQDQPEVLQFYIDVAGIDVSVKNGANVTLCMRAAFYSWRCFQLLLPYVVDLERRSDLGMMLLHWATRGCGATTCVPMLVERGADINALNSKGQTPLMGAAASGRASVVSYLLHHGADPTLATKDGETAVASARLFGHTEVMQLLEMAIGDRISKP